MLFAAGMGIGLMFYGVSEPMSHFSSSIGGTAAENGARQLGTAGGAAGDAIAARNLGMAATIFHWGCTPGRSTPSWRWRWRCFTYNKGLPLTMRSVSTRSSGERVWGWWGHIIDILAVFATLFGLATSLGFGAEQAMAGLNPLRPRPVRWLQGVADRGNYRGGADLGGARPRCGVKVLSEINMPLAAFCWSSCSSSDRPWHLEPIFFHGVAYVKDLPRSPIRSDVTDDNFRQGWTAFYWAWWISWSPFVGMFIARVSRGRTVREFMFCVLIIPSIVSVFWMTRVRRHRDRPARQ
jgi:BCCT family betaine/carnitine transporter